MAACYGGSILSASSSVPFIELHPFIIFACSNPALGGVLQHKDQLLELLLISAFRFCCQLLPRLKAKVHEMLHLIAALAMIVTVYWTGLLYYYRGQTCKAIFSGVQQLEAPSQYYKI